MKAQSICMETYLAQSNAGTRGPVKTRLRLIPLVTRSLTALAAGLSVLLCSIWVIAQPDLVMYLQAVTWSMSFVFFAMAIDAQSPSSSLISLAIGVMLSMTALSSKLLGPEIILLGIVLVAAWLTVTIFRR